MSKKKQEIAHPIDVLVGKNIRGSRVRNDKSQKALGDEIGLTFQQVQKYESGKNRVSASMLFEIAKALKTPVAQFFNNSEQIMTSLGINHPSAVDIGLSDSADGSYAADEKTMMHYFIQIKDKKVKESIVTLLRTLASI